MPKPIPTPYAPTLPPVQAESESVHKVYEAIAPHFSSTRYKPWPLVSCFLSSLPPYTLGLDSGAGNGKYVPLAMDNGREVIVLDMSFGLLEIARETHTRGSKTECVRAELGYEGWRGGLFDWAISIAAIHHLSTPERRAQSVQALLRSLVHSSKPPFSRFMIYVWAYEQGDGSKRKMGKRAKAKASQDEPIPKETDSVIDSLSSDLEKAKILSETTETTKVEEEKVQDVLVPWVYQPKPLPAQPDQPDQAPTEPQVFHRYYHLFVEGELQKLVQDAAQDDGYRILSAPEVSRQGQGKWIRIRGVGWEADNWWIEGEVGL